MGIGVLAPPRPPASETAGGGGDSSWTHLARARDNIDAHLLAGRLEGAGIETRMIVDRSAPGAWLHGGSNPWAPVNIYVRRLQLDDARVVLAEIAFEAPPASVPRDQRRRRAATLWWVSAAALGIVMTLAVLGQALQREPLCDALPFCQVIDRRP